MQGQAEHAILFISWDGEQNKNVNIQIQSRHSKKRFDIYYIGFSACT
jgi:hypothetical protein